MSTIGESDSNKTRVGSSIKSSGALELEWTSRLELESLGMELMDSKVSPSKRLQPFCVSYENSAENYHSMTLSLSLWQALSLWDVKNTSCFVDSSAATFGLIDLPLARVSIGHFSCSTGCSSYLPPDSCRSLRETSRKLHSDTDLWVRGSV